MSAWKMAAQRAETWVVVKGGALVFVLDRWVSASADWLDWSGSLSAVCSAGAMAAMWAVAKAALLAAWWAVDWVVWTVVHLAGGRAAKSAVWMAVSMGYWLADYWGARKVGWWVYRMAAMTAARWVDQSAESWAGCWAARTAVWKADC